MSKRRNRRARRRSSCRRKRPLPTPIGNINLVNVVDWSSGGEPTVVILRGVGDSERFEIDRADMAGGRWIRLPDPGKIDMFRTAGDGTVVALGGQTQSPTEGHMQLLSASRGPLWLDFSAEPWVDEWTFWGDLRPMSAGGFVLTWITTLVTIARDGTVAASPLPHGYFVQAPTSDLDLFLLGKLGDDNGPEARSPAASGLDLFRQSTGQVTHVDAAPSMRESPSGPGVEAIHPSTNHLAFLATTDGRWLSLDAGGKTTQIAPSGAQEAWIAPDGSRAVQVSDPVGVTMVKLPTGKPIAFGPGPVRSAISWGPDGQAAYWTDDPAVGKKLVVLSEDGISLLAAPR